jgi:hypothetical protein
VLTHLGGVFLQFFYSEVDTAGVTRAAGAVIVRVGPVWERFDAIHSLFHLLSMRSIATGIHAVVDEERSKNAVVEINTIVLRID